LPFKFQRRQFPISLCFAMTINKSQGQTLSRVGLYLPQPVFTHGQLYVVISRVKTKRGLKILILDEDGKVTNTTKNVVYKEIFETLWKRINYRYVICNFFFHFKAVINIYQLIYVILCHVGKSWYKKGWTKKSLCTKGIYEVDYQMRHSRYAIYSFFILILTK